LTELSAFAVQFRYETLDQEEPQIDRAETLRKVEAIYTPVQSLLAKSEA
jgi:hypothetical protein